MRGDTLLVVKSGWPLGFRLPAYRAFAAIGLQVAVVDGLVNQSMRFADIPIVCDLGDIGALIRTLRSRRLSPAGVITFNDSGLVAAACIAEAFGLPFLRPETAARAVDKACQREVLAGAGLPQPRWMPVTSAAEATQAVARLGLAIIKPTDRSAGAGVRMVSSPAAAPAAYDAARSESRAGTVLAEEYLDGPEVSVESAAADGGQRAVCVTKKRTTEGPAFVELGHALPYEFPGKAAVVDAAQRACKALGLCHGMAHTELKLTPAGPVVIEVNPRLAGDCIPDLVRLALGIDLYELAAREAVGEPQQHVTRAAGRSAASIQFLLNPRGIFRGARSPLLDAPPPWLADLSIVAEPGMPLPEPDCNGGRAGYAIAVAEEAEEAEHRALQAIHSVELLVSRE